MAFVLYPHAALATPAPPAPVDAALRAVGERLLAAAETAAAYGLAAAHIGEPAPVIVLNLTADHPPASYLLLFNPSIVAVATETAPGKEASVSLPGAEVEIDRPVWAEIGYEDETGAARTMRLEGFVARCALHEIEQMNGRFFLANLSRLKRDMALKKSQKRRQG